MIDQDTVCYWLAYHPDGYLTWKRAPPRSSVKVGSRFGCKHGSGYRVGGFLGRQNIPEHRLVWLYHTGEWCEMLDHKDRIKDNNKISNLRPTNHQLNGRNRSKQDGCSSTHIGVCYMKSSGKWLAYLKVDGKPVHLGTHPTEEAAIQARKAGELVYFNQLKVN